MYYRRSSDPFEAAAAGFLGFSFLVAAIVVVVVIILVVSLVTELWRIFKTRAFHHTPGSRILWIALASLLGLWLLAGLLATQPETASAGLVLACWSFFVFVLICELTDWYLRRNEPRVPETISLADVVSWHTNGSLPDGGARDGRERGGIRSTARI